MHLDFLESPIGLIEIKASVSGITGVNFVDGVTGEVVSNNHTDLCKQQLTEYFAGTREVFELPLDQQGTDFQRSVWQQLVTIPYGKSVCYQDIANSLDNPKAVRAVGAANGQNQIAIIVPCHRVIGSNWKLTGYAGGLNRKEWLLKHEGVKFKTETNQVDPSQLSFDL